jgi:hypothetical protein
VTGSCEHGNETSDSIKGMECDPVEKKSAQYKQKYLNYVSRMEDTG